MLFSFEFSIRIEKRENIRIVRKLPEQHIFFLIFIIFLLKLLILLHSGFAFNPASNNIFGVLTNQVQC